MFWLVIEYFFQIVAGSVLSYDVSIIHIFYTNHVMINISYCGIYYIITIRFIQWICLNVSHVTMT